MQKTTSPGFSLIIRLEIRNQPGMLSRVLSEIAGAGGDMDAVDIVGFKKGVIVRELTINAYDEEHEKEIVSLFKKIDGVRVVSVFDRIFHAHMGGKLDVVSRGPLNDQRDLSRTYTPGVARVSLAIHRKPELVYHMTMKKNMVAVVTDGTAVLGLGNIGPAAALPVMEGKAALFKRFGNVNAFPICLNTTDSDEIVETVKRIAVGFGGINLEDISAPRCFEIEERLERELDIPVFHDDQHGTAIVVLAALLNSVKLTGRKLPDIKVVVNGAGAAGMACTRLMQEAGVRNIILCDTAGALYPDRPNNMNPIKIDMAKRTNPNREQGVLAQVIRQADLFVGVSGPGTLTTDAVRSMAPSPIVFALANPVPEIMPEEIYDVPGVIIATGRSDYPNQINNVLCFPGLFRGALDCHASSINTAMKLKAAHTLADIVGEERLSPDYIIPSVFDPAVAPAVAKAVQEEAARSGVARKMSADMPVDMV
ncbi:MAG: malate dehydrogenase [Elusimicrobia bacterium RIFOXYB2_FULL_49_7]|nr:MAG: malate dehydrogenase [Elusimicrobia bacterium RIFOXYB2_FULL_49_7]